MQFTHILSSGASPALSSGEKSVASYHILSSGGCCALSSSTVCVGELQI